MTTPVVDFHIHPIYYEQYGESALRWIKSVHRNEDWDEFYNYYRDPNNFVHFLRSHGVDYGVILAELTPAVTGICTNEYVLRFCEGYDELIPFASINPYLHVNPGQKLKQLVREGFCGLKLYPTYQYFYPNDAMLYPVYACAEELQIPVMLHTGSSIFKGARVKYGNPLFLDDVAVDFPDLPLLLVHSGRGFWYNDAFFLTRLHENVYMEIAGLPPHKLTEYFPELDKVADKVVFGSDWPGVTDLSNNIDTIRQLPLRQESKDRILGGNAANLLGLKL